MPIVQVSTRFGSIVIELFPDVAPGHVRNFIELTEQGFYSGSLFHRVIPGFMLQGGDPNSKLADRRLHGTGGSGKNLPAEFSDLPHIHGVLSMARSALPDSASSQFFIVLEDSQHLDGQYTLFGRVVEGMDVADRIALEQIDHRDNPVESVAMEVTVLQP